MLCRDAAAIEKSEIGSMAKHNFNTVKMLLKQCFKVLFLYHFLRRIHNET